MSGEPKTAPQWFVRLLMAAVVAALGLLWCRHEALASRVSASEIRAERVQAQYEEIVRRLERIERKLDERK